MMRSRIIPSGGGGGGGGASENPMLNPLILDTLFEVGGGGGDDGGFSVKDISQFRLVCSSWKQASLKSWRSSATLNIFQKEPRCSLRNQNRGVGLGVAQFLQLVKDDEHAMARTPFCSFRLKEWDLSSSSVEAPLEFFRTCGPWIKRLVLEGGEFHNVDRFRDLLFRDTPALEELTIRRCEFWFEYNTPEPARQYGVQPKLEILRIISTVQQTEYRYWPIDWHEIFNCFTNLKTLLVHNISESRDETGATDWETDGPVEDRPTLTKMFEALVTQRRAGALGSLVNLQLTNIISTGLEQDILDLFREADLSLEHLKIDFGSETEEPIARQMIGLYVPTLRKLYCSKSLFRFRTPRTPYDDFLGGGGRFEFLTDLRLVGAMAQNFSFLQYTPALQTLHVTGCREFVFEPVVLLPSAEGGGQPQRVVNHELRMENLTELKTDVMFAEAEQFLSVTKWMPRISRLSVPLNKATFEVACAEWRGTLKELHLPVGSELGDEELTGVPKEDTSAATAAEENRSPNNISNLSGLEKFTQGSNPDFGYDRRIPNPFSEHAVRHGFLLLPLLKSLQFFVDEELPQVVMTLLEEKIPELDVATHRDYIGRAGGNRLESSGGDDDESD